MASKVFTNFHGSTDKTFCFTGKYRSSYCACGETKIISSPHPFWYLLVEMDHLFGSKWLLNEATRLGWCVCPNEVTPFKQSIMLNEKIEDYVNKLSDGCFGQWQADSVDHNVRSLDEKGTLHDMVIVLSLTGSKEGPASLQPVLISRKKLLKVAGVIQSRQIDVLSYIAPQESGLSKIKLSSFENLKITTMKPKDSLGLTLAHSSFHTNQ